MKIKLNDDNATITVTGEEFISMYNMSKQRMGNIYFGELYDLYQEAVSLHKGLRFEKELSEEQTRLTMIDVRRVIKKLRDGTSEKEVILTITENGISIDCVLRTNLNKSNLRLV